MRVVVPVRSVASGERTVAALTVEVITRIERERHGRVCRTQPPQVPVRRTPDEDALAHRRDEPREPHGSVARPRHHVLGVEHEHGRPGSRVVNDRERVAEKSRAGAAAGVVVRDDELAVPHAEVDLRPGHALREALAKAVERVVRVAAAPASAVRLQLDDAAVGATDDRLRMCRPGWPLPDQAMRSPLEGSKRWICSGAKRSPTRSPIRAAKPGGAIARSRRGPTCTSTICSRPIGSTT